MEQENLLALFENRSELAIAYIKKQYGIALYGLAMNILNDPQDAEEAVSDTYLALWNTIPPEKPERIDSYCFRVCKNLSLKKLRHRSAQKRNGQYDLSIEELSEFLPGGDLESQIDTRALGSAINRFLDSLPQSGQVLFLRRYWFGDSVAQAASILGITQNAANVRLCRIKDKLKHYLIKEGFFRE